MKRLWLAVVALLLAGSVGHGDEQLPARSWDELKAETLARAERGAYPVFHLDIKDVHEALDEIHSLSPEEWGAAWMRLGDRHFAQAQSLAAAEPNVARDEYLAAC